MKSFTLGAYKNLDIPQLPTTKTKDVEINEAVRIISMELEEDEKDLLPELLPLVKKNIEEEKARLLPYTQMDSVIGAIVDNSQYEFDEEELKARTDELCESFLDELDQREIEPQEYFTMKNSRPSDLIEECRLESSRRLLTEAVLDCVIEAEKITLSPEERTTKMSMNEQDVKSRLRAKAMVTLLEYNIPKVGSALTRV